MYQHTTDFTVYNLNWVYPYPLTNPQPTAHLTVNRNRLKLYGNSVYLQNNSNFEIELFNPSTVRVLAKISVNGSRISDSGLIINPGQRVYLERFLTEDKRFKFSTYEIENSEEAKSAIRNNGEVTVDFYEELRHYDNSNYLIWNTPITAQPATFPNWTVTCSQQLLSESNSAVYTNYCNSSASETLNLSDQYVNTNFKSNDKTDSIETGRVEMGSKSQQKLVQADGHFYFYPCTSFSVKILPKSQEPIEISDVRQYCSQCGRRWRTSELFCPKCGTPKNTK